jgi:4-hydroxy-4-methyl-2-oxoglutarate aldolase
VKETLGDVNVPISCGDTLVRPGDVIVADEDGVVVVSRQSVDGVLAAAEARVAKEEASRTRYRAGELGLDVNDKRGRLEAKGLTYVRQADWKE